ncbi:MAG: C1 family peptidase [Candidatus Hydrogenedentes bacterium]|nr:C1 family peptidase [Candidatus Hydrogenedentota bacterium]
MKLTGLTPLAQAGIDEKQRQFLKSLWIESIEEAVAAESAVKASDIALEKSGLELLVSSTTKLQTLSPSRLSAARATRQGGKLGCLVGEEQLDDFHKMGRLRPTRAIPLGAFKNKSPDTVRLMDKMQPVRNQGERGTCVAFATVALREFLLGGQDDLSEQFLYWACKELDGQPDPGTFVHTAMSALAEYGVCPESDWSYNPNQTTNEGQGPPTPQALHISRTFRLKSARTVEPDLVPHYKSILAGDNGNNGMPVTFGTLVFNSWYMSAETHRTGKITLPLPGEAPAGGHAWCVVGYVDDSDVPGGGYFIIRNSWGSDWAPDSPEAAGHAMMPYAYVEGFAMEAFTGPHPTMTATNSSSTITLAQCSRTLERDEREALNGIAGRGRLLKSGTKVLGDCIDKAIFLEATPANETKFQQCDYTWTGDSRQQAWFLPLNELSLEARNKFASIRALRERFVSAIHQNIFDTVGTPFPLIKMPWRFSFLPFAWEPTIKKVEPAANLTDTFCKVIRKYSGTPEGLKWPDYWCEFTAGLNDVQVYSLIRGKNVIHVVAAFITPLKMAKQTAPGALQFDQEYYENLQRIYKDWCRTSGVKQPQYVYLTVGCEECPDSDAFTTTSGNHWLMISEPDNVYGWKTSTPKRFGDRHSICKFIAILKPETSQERIARIKECVDLLVPEGGNITLERIKQNTGYRKPTIKKTFLVLQEQEGDEYRLYRTNDGHLAIRKPRPNESKSITANSLRRSLIHSHGLRFLGAAFGVSAWSLRGILNLSGLSGFIGFVVLIYISSCIQKAFNQRADNDKE